MGNEPNAPALEVSLSGPTLRAEGDIACVVYGAPFALTCTRRPAAPLSAGKTFTLRAGDELRIGGTPTGMRAYLCVRGGLRVPAFLGSCSALAPVTAGDLLPCLPGRIHARFLRAEFGWNGQPSVLRVLDGPQTGWVRAEDFLAKEFTVTPAADRMGLRLHGRALEVARRELTSEPVCPGSVQVTSDGQCIVLGVDGQTIGGYPKIAQVVTADVDKLAQLRPGQAVRFARVGLEEAVRLYREKQAELREWLLRLQWSLDGIQLQRIKDQPAVSKGVQTPCRTGLTRC